MDSGIVCIVHTHLLALSTSSLGKDIGILTLLQLSSGWIFFRYILASAIDSVCKMVDEFNVASFRLLIKSPHLSSRQIFLLYSSSQVSSRN